MAYIAATGRANLPRETLSTTSQTLQPSGNRGLHPFAARERTDVDSVAWKIDALRTESGFRKDS
jgi:hypothetical protein